MKILNNKKKSSLLLLLFIAFSMPAEEKRYRPDLFPSLGDSSVISMVTVYPGDEIYSLFGHSSFRVYDPENNIDWMFNYGTFDFSDSLFVPKFIAGKLDYYLDVNDFKRSLYYYSVIEKRSVVEQVLDLDYEEKSLLFEFLVNNGRVANRYYKYDFIYDNCSTRIADAMIKCFGERVVFPSDSGKSSFRKMIRGYLGKYPFLDTGIQLALGSPSDRIPEGTENFFLPVPMIEGFDRAVFGLSGNTRPLVSEKKILNQGEFDRGVSFNYPFFIFLFILVFEVLCLFLLYKKVGGNIFEKVVLITENSMLILSGIAGLLLFYLWFLSDHTVPDWNFNILWISPLNAALLFPGLSVKNRVFRKTLSKILLVSSLLFLPVILSGLQSIPISLVPLYCFFIIVFLRRSGLLKFTQR